MRKIFRTQAIFTVGMLALALATPSARAQQLIDQWTFNESSGTVAHNSVPRGANGTLVNGATFGPGVTGNAVYLPPYASVNFPQPTGNLGLSDFTIRFWLKGSVPGGASSSEVLGNRGDEGSASTPFVDIRMLPTGSLTLEINGNQGVGYNATQTDPSQGRVDDGKWHSISAVRTGTLIALYVDGALRGTGSPTDGNLANIQSLSEFAAGSNADAVQFTLPFNGAIDDLQIYDQAPYWSSGFLFPVFNPPAVNTGKAGWTYPLLWLLEGTNAYGSALSAVDSITYASTSCSAFTVDPTGAAPIATTGVNSLRVTATLYSDTWVTPAAGCYTLFLTVNSGQVFHAFFNLK